MRILVVKDDHLLNHTLCYNLSAAGYTVGGAITKAVSQQALILHFALPYDSLALIAMQGGKYHQ